MASEIRVNTINNRSGLGTISITNTGAVFSGVTTFAQIQTTSGEITVGTGASVFSPATNVLALGTNNTEKVRITSTGRVGIGTDDPTRNVHISGTTTNILRLENTNANVAGIELKGSTGQSFIFHNSDDLRFLPGGTEQFRITSGGNVAVNDTGNAGYTSFSPCIALGDSGDSKPALVIRGSATSVGDISFCDNSGTESEDGVSEGLIRYDHNTDHMEFHTADSERLRINSSGNVGIGTENPDKKLRVEGDARITGTLTMGTASISIDGTVEYPSIRPSLDLNFAATKVLDDVITFTRDSIGTYTDELGIIRTAPNNTPRFDHDPETGESLGLLIEESRTNRFVNSIPGTVWSKTNVGSVTTNTTTANYATAPDGTTTATRWQWNIGSTGSDRAILRQGTGSLGSSTLVTLSIYLKSNTGSNQSIALHADGSASSSTSVTVTTEWKRFRFTYTSAIGINNGVEAKGGLTASSGDILVWGAQMEIGGFPTSYIPTSGSTVTRAADFATINGTNFTEIFNTLEGTFFAECDRGNDGTEGAGIGAIRASADSYQNMIQFGEFYDNSGYVGRVYVSGSATALIGATHTTGQGVYNKYALAYKENDFAGTINSVIQSTDNSGALPTGLDRFLFGGYNDDRTNNNLDGHIKRLSYYPKRLPNAQLQGLTQQ